MGELNAGYLSWMKNGPAFASCAVRLCWPGALNFTRGSSKVRYSGDTEIDPRSLVNCHRRLLRRLRLTASSTYVKLNVNPAGTAFASAIASVFLPACRYARARPTRATLARWMH